MDERVLVEEMKAGSQKAFETLFECYLERVVKTVYLITGNRQDSEDIAQETFVQCYLHKKELKENESFKSWIYCIATRIAWRYCKKRNREIPMEALEETLLEEASIEGNEILDRILQKETSNYVMAFINRLSIKHKMVIVLYYYNECSTKEIAKILNCMEGTVKSRLFVARKELKKSMESKNLEEVCCI